MAVHDAELNQIETLNQQNKYYLTP